MQKSAVTSKSDGVKNKSCSMPVCEVVWNTPSHSWQRKKIRVTLVEKRIGDVKSMETSYKKLVLVGSYIQL